MATMKKLSMATAGAALIALGIGGAAQATVLTFDDLSPISFELIPDGYAGFNWDNFYALNSSNPTYLGSGYPNGTVSGNVVAFNGSGEAATLADGLFDFNSAYLTAAWRNGLSITVEGLKDGLSLYSETVVVDITGPTLFDFDFLGIDTLVFTSFGGVNPGGLNGDGTQFVMDNFTFNETKGVPEPASTLGLLAFGALGASSVLKRKKEQKA